MHLEKHSIGISGGKDSDVAAFETRRYLRELGHKGPLILIHSDLGRVKHKDSLPACQHLADRLRLELVVVHRQSGDMMDRWLQRYHDNVARYCDLLCLKFVFLHYTTYIHFYTNELKTAIRCRYLVERFPWQIILSVVGPQREESTTRAQAPICSAQAKLTSKTFKTTGYNLNPILAWTLAAIDHKEWRLQVKDGLNPASRSQAILPPSRGSFSNSATEGLNPNRAQAILPLSQ